MRLDPMKTMQNCFGKCGEVPYEVYGALALLVPREVQHGTDVPSVRLRNVSSNDPDSLCEGKRCAN